MEVICIHGFMGRPDDWKSLKLESHIDAAFTYYDLFASEQGIVPFDEWAYLFNQNIRRKSVLVGYSLGGRLAMHAALANPDLFAGVVIISANYGLNDRKLKSSRWERDLVWADKIMNMPWEKFLGEWNSQPVFSAGDEPFPRKEQDYNRDMLAKSLLTWSLAKQECLKENLQKLSVPVLWAAGEKDTIYAQQAQTLAFQNKDSNIWIATESGHRVPWQNPKEFTHQLKEFINRINGEIHHVSGNCSMANYQTV